MFVLESIPSTATQTCLVGGPVRVLVHFSTDSTEPFPVFILASHFRHKPTVVRNIHVFRFLRFLGPVVAVGGPVEVVFAPFTETV